MGTCTVCGNEYDRSFQITMNGEKHEFDSFECAIHKLAPRCAHCDCTVIGHGVQSGETIFCCAHCAKQTGIKGVEDRAEARH